MKFSILSEKQFPTLCPTFSKKTGPIPWSRSDSAHDILCL